jgi:hypothetical protein
MEKAVAAFWWPERVFDIVSVLFPEHDPSVSRSMSSTGAIGRKSASRHIRLRMAPVHPFIQVTNPELVRCTSQVERCVGLFTVFEISPTSVTHGRR